MESLKQRIIFFTKYTSKGPSSRYRTYQYLDYFKDEYSCHLFPFFDDDYIERLYIGRIIPFYKVLFYYLRRIWHLMTKPKKKDIIFIEYELMPYFFAWAELFLKLRGIKYLVDYDDAIFHNYDTSYNVFIRIFLKNKIPKVIKHANYVITGSPYLTAFAFQYNRNVTEIPTSILFKKYENIDNSNLDDFFVIGWIGSKSTSHNLLIIKDALEKFKQCHSDVVIRLVGVDIITAKALNITPVLWTEQDELQLLNSFHIGIMPLIDNNFNKGKCGFKLIQYMACGKPTISTPLDANVKINRNKKNLHAITNEEWFQSFEEMYTHRAYYEEVGKENRKLIADYYSVEANASAYNLVFKSLCTNQ